MIRLPRLLRLVLLAGLAHAGSGPALAGTSSGEPPEVELLKGAAPTVRVGHAAVLSLSIAPRPGVRLLRSGPLELRPRGTGLRVPHSLYRRQDAVDPDAEVPRFEVEVLGQRPGPARLEVDCLLYLCRGERCRPVKARTSWSLEVQP